MCKGRYQSRGFTLIAALLLMLIMSGIALGLMYLVNSESRIGGNDMETNRAFYGAESGMELLTANLANLYQTSMAPTPAQITALTAFPPTSAMVGPMTYRENITWDQDAAGNPKKSWNTISQGPNAGLVAEIVPLTLNVEAIRPSGADVSISRRVEVALIPVFQFGVFCDGDCSYFAGPDFNFAGRVHANGNLFVAEGDGRTLTFTSNVTAFGEIVRDRLANGWPTSSNYNGTVYAPNATGGCNSGGPASNCLSYAVPQASWSGGIPPAGGAVSTWPNTSQVTYNGFLANHTTGVARLSLPFVSPGVGPVQIIRKPAQGEAASSPLGSSRLYNKAQIRVLLADTQNDLHPGVAGDAQDINLETLGAVNVGGTVIPFARANTALDANWLKDSRDPVGTTQWSLFHDAPAASAPATFSTWLRVEYKNAAGNWIGVTTEWLGLGFARDFEAPKTPGSNLVNPNAILILQALADRNGDGVYNGTDGMLNAASEGVATNYYPINLYDPREGNPRDVNLAGTQCNVNGIMNAVEIDVGNLRRWLGQSADAKGPIGGSGTQVDYTSQNGYVLYFSDRRGQLPSPLTAPPALIGEYGFEDVINSGSVAGTPDGVLEPGANGSPEDVDQNGQLDRWGAADVGYGFGLNVGGNPYQSVNCTTFGRANRVTGARHVLKLVDGGLGNLPTRLDNNQGGFTVVSENPVYVQGDYNAGGGAGFSDPGHAAAAVMGDAVTLLSNNWSDSNSLRNPNNLGGRAGNTTWYRMAIAAGKNMNFPQPAWGARDMGTDGGMHNFLRYVESWGGTLYYRGSLVSLYYAQYATGVYKCCTTVYSPPTRNYSFDTLFLNPDNLPPGTPMFQDVVNLSYRQDFTPY
jgi:type IV pilus assembly PilX-like protein